ncbi:ketosamine-3-kinase-like [Lethenteron reissneri]|uniref:ketosamine-3-kinase-like n=1 Tax=Lethenteron reissneri TaxID=7753 RepID=UPI002AB75E5F|nr:ketosamine-3-kinase-like [Lethenteron reissneri]XP_061412000.1 ketosamine-3-kinase-like [Lethenteron reissneri]XP_061412007.1 ketosamine-3-kinase-like [Lethenteron reissneri]XP_061412013.1 ketosamine-3-kinase-like [Lethenteron reissneri]
MESLLRAELGTDSVRPLGAAAGGGCISAGQSYETGRGRVFAKINVKSGAKCMFDGEFASLEAIASTRTVRVPKQMKVIEIPTGGALLVMEHLDMKSLNRGSGLLGQQLAEMHLHNRKIGERLHKEEKTIGKVPEQEDVEYVDKFGFHTATSCGYIPQLNEWQEDWVTFFSRQRLQLQLDMIEKDYGDRETRELWSQLQLRLGDFFRGVEVVPALLHGDLWTGNAAEINEGPVIFDPASFYGHSEYELSISGMFASFSSTFYSSYHALIPKSEGFDKRQKLYQLFHYLNHWNHFGTGYRGSSISTMRSLLK